jgi:DNA polymerase (family 10)
MVSIRNYEISQILYNIAELLDLQSVKFKPMAYRRAAQNIESLSEDIEDIYKRGELEEIPGVGKGIASRIKEYLETGKLIYLEELKREFPKGMEELIKIEGIGPKTALKLIKELKINTVEELEEVIKQGKLNGINGFGMKKEENILRGIEFYKASKGRFLLGDILPIANLLEDAFKKMKFIQKVNIAGSIRRKNETVRDIDILAVSKEPQKVIKFFTEMKNIKEVLTEGETKCSVILTDKLQVDLRVIDASSYGSALQYFTGSKDHNVKLRQLAKRKKWKLNEYGLFNTTTNEKIAGENEKEIYTSLDLEYIEPELRENRGEIEAAQKRILPKLVELDQIKGDLHVHTVWSDGSNSIEEMAEAAKQLNYEYIAICDHARGLQIVRSLSERDIIKQLQEIELINRKMEDFTVLSGIELNIDARGQLDIKNAVLKDLDIVISSIHSGFKQEEKKMTERVLKAIHNDNVNILGHPMGRIINRRSPLNLNLLKVFETASELGVLMEINAFPDRLDLSDINCFTARDHNIQFSIGTDAHSVEQLNFMEFGISTARRGWLESKHIVNTFTPKDLKKLI